METILITNVTHFLGADLVSHFLTHRPEASIVCHDRSFGKIASRQSFIESLPEKCRKNSNLKLAQSTEPESLFAEVGPVTVLVNHDVYPAKRIGITEITKDELSHTFNDLTIFPFLMSKWFVKPMMEKRRGKVLFITSATAIRGLPLYSAYAVARGATNTLAVTLAKEVAKYDIQVNALCPNFVENPTYYPKELISDPIKYQKITQQIPLGRLASAREAVEYIAFLTSSSSNFITGQVIPFAGGWC